MRRRTGQYRGSEPKKSGMEAMSKGFAVKEKGVGRCEKVWPLHSAQRGESTLNYASPPAPPTAKTISLHLSW